jgi:hypothetical protein
VAPSSRSWTVRPASRRPGHTCRPATPRFPQAGTQASTSSGSTAGRGRCRVGRGGRWQLDPTGSAAGTPARSWSRAAGSHNGSTAPASGRVGLGTDPLGWGLPTQRLVRPWVVVLVHPGVQDLLDDLGAGQRRQGGQQLAAQGLVEPLDLAGGVGARTPPGRWAMPFSRKLRSTSTSPRAGLWRTGRRTARALSVKTSSGTP